MGMRSDGGAPSRYVSISERGAEVMDAIYLTLVVIYWLTVLAMVGTVGIMIAEWLRYYRS